MTKIAYISLLAMRHPGIEHKIQSQARALDQLGIEDFDICFINTERDGVDGRVRYVRVDKRSRRGFVDLALRRFHLIERVVPCERYDLLYVRYPFADPEAPSFAARHPVVTEHNTIEVKERLASIRSSGQSLSMRAYRTGSMALESFYGPMMLRRCRGIVAVTDEIRAYELRRSGRHLTSLTLANGIDVDRVPHTAFRPFRGDRLRIVFVGGRTSPWHGLDRLIASLSFYAGTIPIECHIAGHLSVPHASRPLPASVQVITHGVMHGANLDELLAEVNLAVGTLALHRNGMMEASPLKIREYTARGLPFVLAHEDPDLADVAEDERFFLPVSNDEQLLDVESLIRFAEEMAVAERETDVSERMRSYALQNMDWKSKMGTLVGFLQHVAAGRSS